ncbi:MAG: hypothetical protein A3I11_07565 [Elusimicrobia bacterium RIFCSPLOWO2_02_FULL_39_32]|nr:MAG: hypothetical protein A3I11_07565 [Elusimicrobia bacterium RIFCSPLOWO2_02_FULL_39_32]
MEIKMVEKIVAKIENSSLDRLKKIICTAVFLFVFGMMTHEKYSGSGDEPHYMMISYSLVFDQDLDLSNNYGDKNNIIFDGNLSKEEAHARIGGNGKLFPSHDIGMSLLFAPYFSLSYILAREIPKRLPIFILDKIKMKAWEFLKLFLGFGMIFFTCFMATQIFDLCFYFSQDKTKSFFWTFFCAISPPILSHSFLFFTEIPTACGAIFIYKKIKMEEELSAQKSLFLGILSASLILIHIRNIVLAGILLFLIFLKSARSCLSKACPERNPGGAESWGGVEEQSRQMNSRGFLRAIKILAIQKKFVLLNLALGVSLILFLRTWLNLYLWGSSLTTKHLLLHNFKSLNVEMFLEIILRAFAIFFDQEGGLFIYAPIYILCFAGFTILFKKSKSTFFELLLPCLINVLTIVSFPFWNHHGWSGFWSPAARYLVPIIPFCALATFFVFIQLKSLTWIVKGFIGLQIFINLFFWQFPKLLWNDGDGISALSLFLKEYSSFNFLAFIPTWNQFSWNSFIKSMTLSGLCLWITLNLLRKLKPSASNR